MRIKSFNRLLCVLLSAAAAGDLEILSSTDYIYTHPVTDTEQDIIISFVDIEIRDDLNCDIA